jgi:acyl-CoA thioester hydrolase
MSLAMTDLPQTGRFDGRVHHLPVRIYYEDTDFSGVVYHANYLRYFERARSDFFRAAGIHHAELAQRADPVAFAVTRMEIDWAKPARIDDALVVRTTFDRVTGARMFASQSISRGEDLLCRASVCAVVMGLDGRPRRPPPDIMRLLAAYLAPNPQA